MTQLCMTRNISQVAEAAWLGHLHPMIHIFNEAEAQLRFYFVNMSNYIILPLPTHIFFQIISRKEVQQSPVTSWWLISIATTALPRKTAVWQVARTF